MDRREFVKHTATGLAAAATGLSPWQKQSPGNQKTAENAPQAQKLLTGSFMNVFHPNVWSMAYSDETARWGEDSWRAVLRDMHNIGMDTVIWANTALWGRPFFSGYEKTVGKRLRILGCQDPLMVCAEEADRLGMKIFYGFGLRGRVSQVRDYSGMEPYWPKVFFTWNRALAVALIERYGDRPSFAGLYNPYEFSQKAFMGDDDPINLYKKLILEYLRPAIGNVKIMISPGCLGSKLTEAQLDNVPRVMEQMDIDILAPQDCAGRDYFDAPIEKALKRVRAQVRAYKRIRKPLNDAGITLWANCETFAREHCHPDGRKVSIAGSFERIKQQMALQAPHVEKLITWIYPGVMNKRTELVNIGHPSTDKLYHKYVKYLKKEFPARFKNL